MSQRNNLEMGARWGQLREPKAETFVRYINDQAIQDYPSMMLPTKSIGLHLSRTSVTLPGWIAYGDASKYNSCDVPFVSVITMMKLQCFCAFSLSGSNVTCKSWNLSGKTFLDRCRPSTSKVILGVIITWKVTRPFPNMLASTLHNPSPPPPPSPPPLFSPNSRWHSHSPPSHT